MRAKGPFASILSWGLLVLAAPASAANLVYLGGPVVRSAKAVDIFWGPSFANPASPDYSYAQRLILFRNQFGTNPEYNIITQYYQIVGGVRQHIQLSNLAAGTPDWFDTSTPPADVTDADAQAEVRRYLANHAFDASTIYEIFLPSTSYSSFGGGTSCGGPQLAFCAYHNVASGTTSPALYTVQPYASCSACQVAGWTADQNQDRNVAYATRSTVVNPHFNSWYDPNGNTGDDLCGWTPPPFLDGGFGYPYDWSNAANGCVKTR